MKKGKPRMRFFPHEWGRTEAKAAATRDAYERFIASLGEGVGAKIHAFAWAQSLNTNYLDRLQIVTGSRQVNLALISGDRQQGYNLLTIKYVNAKILDRAAAIKAMYFRGADIRYDEFDLAQDGTNAKYVHRLLMWPRRLGVIEISFDDFETAKEPLDSRGYVTYDLIFEEVESVDEE